jgi:transcriptional regulator with XRE-family HTH domain
MAAHNSQKFGFCKKNIQNIWINDIIDVMKVKKLTLINSNSTRNPHYIKIGKRIHQARMMAKESNSRALSVRLGWSAGRIHNYETGLSTPGIDETLQFCEALKVDPSWLTYGIDAPRSADTRSNRYLKFIDALDKAEQDGALDKYLAVIKLAPERMARFRNNSNSKIPDLMARRCEKYLGMHRGWIDEATDIPESQFHLSADVQDLLSLYQKLSAENKKKFYAIGELLLI